MFYLHSFFDTQIKLCIHCSLCFNLQNAETVKVLSFTKHDYDEMKKAKQQLENEVENLRLEQGTIVRALL